MRERVIMNAITVTDIYDIEPVVAEGGLTEIRTIGTTVPGVEVKHATWKPGHRSTLSAHADRQELLIIESGILTLYMDDADAAQEVDAGSVIDIPAGQIHGHAVPQDADQEVIAWAIFVPVAQNSSE
jgi:mannose-6-phosphate isomerase-like protein (cupin superfamily)